MSGETQNGFDAALLDDFFAEADEHLLAIRRELLRLETSVGGSYADPKIVESLFHEFHSFKGISAIVGLASAESAAHATEEFLRLIKGGRTKMTETGWEVLMSATQKLEQIVAAFRSGNPLPECDSLLSDLKEQCDLTADTSTIASPAQRPSPADQGQLKNIEEAKVRGLDLWKFTYSPTPELKAEGVNINNIREELAKTGEILKSTPLVAGEGAISFEFVVGMRGTPTDIAEWASKGVAVQSAVTEQAALAGVSPMGTTTGPENVHNPFLTPSHVVRVDLKRLDELMRITGEMVIHRSRLDIQLAKLNGAASRFNLRDVHEVNNRLGRSLRELREAIMHVRMVPVAEIFARMPFVVRDLVRQTHKKARLKLQGQDTALDKYLIERLKDPLLHLVRNAFTHGVETLEERAAAAKPEEATIELSATSVGDSVLIQVRDDGRGIDAGAIIDRARKLGFEVSDRTDNAAILKILCSSGFSTRDEADRAAGRGVGMAVVYTTVRELGGTLTLESEAGRGTTFTLRLPLTLAILETLIVSAAGQTCAVPQSFAREILQTNERQIQIVNGIEVIPYRAGVLPVVRLTGLFGLKTIAKPKMCLLVIQSDLGSVGLLVENVIGQREVVVRPLRDPLIQVPGVSGATELGDGKPVLILDGTSLTSGSVRPPEALDSPAKRN